MSGPTLVSLGSISISKVLCSGFYDELRCENPSEAAMESAKSLGLWKLKMSSRLFNCILMEIIYTSDVRSKEMRLFKNPCFRAACSGDSEIYR